MTTFEARADVAHQLDDEAFEAVEREVMQQRGGTLMLHPHRVELEFGVSVSPRLAGKAGLGQTIGLDYTWRTNEQSWAPTFGVQLLTERFDTSRSSVERVSYQALAGLESPVINLGPTALHGSVGLVGMWTEQDKRQDGSAPENLHFQRAGAHLQLSAEVPVSEVVGWSLNLEMIPSVFFERELANTAPEDPSTSPRNGTHVAVSTALLATLGVVIGL